MFKLELFFSMALVGCGSDFGPTHDLRSEHETPSRNSASENIEILDTDVDIDSNGDWKTLLFTGDNEISAFDNARKTVSKKFLDLGVKPENMKQLSLKSEFIGKNDVGKTTPENIEEALGNLVTGEDDRCLIHMTSHGSRSGFYLAGQDQLRPTDFAGILDRTCGDRPTVILISACYSGIFSDFAELATDNRVILTAARADRTSFGCGVENEYTFWDACLIDSLEQAGSWSNLFTKVDQCISVKEASMTTPSVPQKHIGAAVEELAYIK